MRNTIHLKNFDNGIIQPNSSKTSKYNLFADELDRDLRSPSPRQKKMNILKYRKIELDKMPDDCFTYCRCFKTDSGGMYNMYSLKYPVSSPSNAYDSYNAPRILVSDIRIGEFELYNKIYSKL